jgi:hypothetical protein
MITPAYSPTATERVLPNLALDFTTAVLDPRVTFTRSGNTATVTDSSGVIVAINADLPRFDYNPSTLICNGLLIEEARTNVLLNSLIDGTSLATQTVTVTAVPHALSFYGTGGIVLSGAHSATVNGTGAYPTRTTYLFTPSAGNLTLTVSGTVQFAQLELGLFPTSFIPTAATATTRNADIATMTGANFSDWFNASEGAFVWQGITNPTNDTARSMWLFSANDGTAGNQIRAARRDTTVSDRRARGQIDVAGAQGEGLVDSENGVFTANVTHKLALAYQLNNMGMAFDGTLIGTDTSVSIPTVDRLNLGTDSTASGATFLNGYMQKFMFYPQRLTNAELTAFSR